MLISAQTFKGVRFTIDIPSFTEVASGGTAKILVGNLAANKQPSGAVAVKVFKTVLNQTEKMLLYRELAIARQVSGRHPFIAPFIGTADIGPETSIVSYYMKNGNLLSYLKANRDVDRKKLIIQVAEAVVFLHSGEGLVHGDLKCANVLISDLGDALLADFGLSTFVEKANSSATTATDIRVMYTVRFAAPELLQDSAGHPRRRSKTRESDIYSFGMLVLEALTEQAPWVELSDFAVIHRVHSGKLPPRPTTRYGFVSISHAWWDICRRCWAYEASSRPTMKTVLDALKLYSQLPDRIIQPPGGPDVHDISTFTHMPCGQRIAVATCTPRNHPSNSSKTISIYDIASGRIVAGPMTRLGRSHNCLAASRDGRRIAAASSSEVTWWDVASGSKYGQPVTLKRDTQWPCFTFSPDAKCVASRTPDGRSICLWDTTTGDAIGEPLLGHITAFSPTGTHVVTLSHRHLFLWQFPTRKFVATAAEPDQTGVCFFPNGERIVTWSEDGIIRIWDTRSLRLQRTLKPIHTAEVRKGDSQYIIRLAVSPSGKYLASAIPHGKISICETETGNPVGMPLAHGMSSVSCLQFSPNGRTLIASCQKVVRVWDLFD